MVEISESETGKKRDHFCVGAASNSRSESGVNGLGRFYDGREREKEPSSGLMVARILPRWGEMLRELVDLGMGSQQ